MAPLPRKPDMGVVCSTAGCGHEFGEHFVTENRLRVGCSHGYGDGVPCECDGFTIVVKYGPYGAPATGQSTAPSVPGLKRRGRPPKNPVPPPVQFDPDEEGEGEETETDADGNVAVVARGNLPPPWPVAPGVIDESGVVR